MRSSTALVAAAGLLFFLGARADTFDFKAGIGPVYGTSFTADKKDGLGFSAYLELGLTETLSLTASGGYADQFIGVGEAYSLSHADLGLLYNLDVLVVVPYLALRLGWLYRSPDQGESRSGLGATVAIGFDYLWTDNFTVGLAAEYHGMLTDYHGFPAYVAFTGRMGFRLEY